MGRITTMTKIIRIPRMIGMTGDWNVKMTRKTGMSRMKKSPWTKVLGTVMKYSYFFSGFPHKTMHSL